MSQRFHPQIDSRIDSVLRAMPATLNEISAATGIATMSAWRIIERLREAGWSYIGRWANPEGNTKPSPVHYAGKGKDREYKTQTKRDNHVRYMRKLKKPEHAERLDRLRATKNTRQWLKKKKFPVDPLVAALFGSKPATESKGA